MHPAIESFSDHYYSLPILLFALFQWVNRFKMSSDKKRGSGSTLIPQSFGANEGECMPWQT